MDKQSILRKIITTALSMSMAGGMIHVSVYAENNNEVDYRSLYLQFADRQDEIANSPDYPSVLSSGMIMADFNADDVPELLTFATYTDGSEVAVEHKIERGYYIKDSAVVESSPWRDEETGKLLYMSYLPEDIPEDTELCTMMVKLNSAGENALFMMYSNMVAEIYEENLITFNKNAGFSYDYAHNEKYNEYYYDNYFGGADNIPDAVNISYYDKQAGRLRTRREALELLLDKYDAKKSNLVENGSEPDHTYTFESNGISVIIDGKIIGFDQPPIIVDDRTLVPVRAIFENLGASVDWDGSTQTVTAQKDDIKILLKIGDNTMYRNNTPIALDVAAQIVNDRTLVPVRAISEAFGCNVDWDGSARSVIITTQNTAAEVLNSGTCGDDLTWTLDDSGTLTISGTGDMYSWYINSNSDYPWGDLRNDIKNIVIEDGVTSIGAAAFYNFKNLTRITIPDSITTIGNAAIRDCMSLESVLIPASVKAIDDYAFMMTCDRLDNCDDAQLTAINVDMNNTEYSSVDGVLFNKDKSYLIACPAGKKGNYVIPDGVTELSDWAFYCSQLSDIVIPEGVTSIPEETFAYCYKLNTITIPKSVKRIHEHAFHGTSWVKDLYYGGTEEEWKAIGFSSIWPALHYNSTITE